MGHPTTDLGGDQGAGLGGDPSSSLLGGSVGAGYAARLGLARDTVARALRAESPPRYFRAPAGSALDVVEPSVRVLLARFPSMPATVLAEQVVWTGSASWFRKQVALLRPEYPPKDPADRLSYWPGDRAQCDLWFPPERIPVGGGQACSPPVLVRRAFLGASPPGCCRRGDTGSAGRDLVAARAAAGAKTRSSSRWSTAESWSWP